MILVAIGSNLTGPAGLPLATCRQAASDLDRLPGLRVIRRSRWYETVPIPASDQPSFVNGVVLLAGEADPAWLLRQLHDIEDRWDRRRSVPNAARTLDLDLIDLDGMVRDGPDPVLPHPRAHERGFVLHPLAELVPDWVHPRSGRPIGALLAALPAQQVRPLETSRLQDAAGLLT